MMKSSVIFGNQAFLSRGTSQLLPERLACPPGFAWVSLHSSCIHSCSSDSSFPSKWLLPLFPAQPRSKVQGPRPTIRFVFSPWSAFSCGSIFKCALGFCLPISLSGIPQFVILKEFYLTIFGTLDPTSPVGFILVLPTPVTVLYLSKWQKYSHKAQA